MLAAPICAIRTLSLLSLLLVLLVLLPCCWLSRLGLKLTDVPDTGSCMYEAVASAIGSVSSSELRTKTCDFLAANWDDFASFVAGETKLEYVTKAREATTWAGNVEICAIQYVVRRPIRVWSADDEGMPRTRDVVVPALQYSSGQRIHLSHHKRVHYQLLTGVR